MCTESGGEGKFHGLYNVPTLQSWQKDVALLGVVVLQILLGSPKLGGMGRVSSRLSSEWSDDYGMAVRKRPTLRKP